MVDWLEYTTPLMAEFVHAPALAQGFLQDCRDLNLIHYDEERCCFIIMGACGRHNHLHLYGMRYRGVYECDELRAVGSIHALLQRAQWLYKVSLDQFRLISDEDLTRFRVALGLSENEAFDYHMEDDDDMNTTADQAGGQEQPFNWHDYTDEIDTLCLNDFMALSRRMVEQPVSLLYYSDPDRLWLLMRACPDHCHLNAGQQMGDVIEHATYTGSLLSLINLAKARYGIPLHAFRFITDQQRHELTRAFAFMDGTPPDTGDDPALDDDGGPLFTITFH